MNNKVSKREGESFKKNFELEDASVAHNSNGMEKMKSYQWIEKIWLVGVACAFVLTPSLALGNPQNDVAIDPSGVIQSGEEAVANTSQQAAEAGWAVAGFDLSLTNVLGALLLTALISLLGYNLLTSRKQGWGWATLVVFAGILAFFLRVGISMFREIASAAHGSSDWDEG